MYVQGCRGDKEVNLREGYILFLRIILILTTFLKAGNIFKAEHLREVSRPWPGITSRKHYNTQTSGGPFKETRHPGRYPKPAEKGRGWKTSAWQ